MRAKQKKKHLPNKQVLFYSTSVVRFFFKMAFTFPPLWYMLLE